MQTYFCSELDQSFQRLLYSISFLTENMMHRIIASNSDLKLISLVATIIKTNTNVFINITTCSMCELYVKLSVVTMLSISCIYTSIDIVFLTYFGTIDTKHYVFMFSMFIM